MAETKNTRKGDSGTTRRGFIGAIGAAAAATTLPAALATPASGGAVVGADSALGAARRWYEAEVDAVTRRWEQRFRHRQYRPDEPGDCINDRMTREPPRWELEHALERLPIVKDDAMSCLVLAVSTHEYEDGQEISGEAAGVMAQDVLERAEQLGYFAVPCPEELRFPDLPVREISDGLSDLEIAEEKERSARACVSLSERGHKDYGRPVEEYRAEFAAAEERLAGIRAGTIEALTRKQKAERHAERRRAIVLAYKARLEGAGHDASWVEVPPYWDAERFAEEAQS